MENAPDDIEENEGQESPPVKARAGEDGPGQAGQEALYQ